MDKKRYNVFNKIFTSLVIMSIIITLFPNYSISAAHPSDRVYTYDNYSIEYTVRSSWDNNQVIDVKITNTGTEPILNWILTYNAGGIISGLHNATEHKITGTTYILKNGGYNYEIQPGQSANFGYTVTGSSLRPPDDIEIISVEAERTDGYDVQYEISDWGTNFQAIVTITNLSPMPIEAWSLTFQGNFTLGNVWDARLNESDGQTYTVASQAWTNPIQYNSSVSFGFMGSKSAGTEATLSDFVLNEVVISEEYLMADEEIDQGDIEVMITDGTIETIRGENGVFSVIDGTFTDRAVTSVDDAAAILNSARSLFGENFYAEADEITSQNLPGDGEAPAMNFYRYTPEIDGIPVLGSEIVLTADEQGTVSSMFNTYNRMVENVDATATVTEQQAVDAALAKLLAEVEITASLQAAAEGNLGYETVQSQFTDSLTVESELVVYAMSGSGAPALAWQVSLATDLDYMPTDDLFLPLVGQDEYIYANGTSSGTVLTTIPQLIEWSPATVTAIDALGESRTFEAEEENGQYRLVDGRRKIKTYNFTGYFSLPGELVTFTGTPEESAASAHANITEVYDFYKNVLGRDSYDGNGADAVSTINYPFYNAQWTGTQMLYGLGHFEAALDVAGHEFTHGVIDNIADHEILLYEYEPGALNESFADIMGALIEDKNGDERWLLGEDIDWGASRNMADPLQFNQPDHYDNRYTGEDDVGGVHINSGIFNFAAHKMMVDYRTRSISDETWAKVFYRSLFHMAADSHFIHGRGAVISVAKSLGFDSNEQQAIKDAFDDVGICEPNTIRISLRWGENPHDLDSHLIGPTTSGSGNFHTYYSNPNYYNDGTSSNYDNGMLFAADLDHDDITSYGPEITTIHTLTPGDYYFYVHDYTNRYMTSSRALANSQARVYVYYGSSPTPFATYYVDTAREGTSWGVFKLTISGNRATCVALNTYEYESSPGQVGP